MSKWPESSRHYISVYEAYQAEYPVLSQYGVEGWEPLSDEEQFGDDREVW